MPAFGRGVPAGDGESGTSTAWPGSALIDAVDAHRIDNRLRSRSRRAPRTPTGPGAAGCTRTSTRADVFVATLLARTPGQHHDPADAHSGADGGDGERPRARRRLP